MCEHCDPSQFERICDMVVLKFGKPIVDEGVFYGTTADGLSIRCQISFCPFCGRPLNESTEMEGKENE